MIDVMVQINNPRNGSPASRIGGICISGVIDLEPMVLPEPCYSIDDNKIGIHRFRVPYAYKTPWVGNWCWDSLRMKPRYAAQLIAGCLAERCEDYPLWGIQSATGEAMIELADKHRDGKTVTADMILAAWAADRVDGAA